MKWPGAVGPSYESLSKIVAGERTINFYPEIIEAEAAKAQRALYPCPGLSDFATLTDSPGRAIFEEESGRLFAVFGTTLYEVASDGTPTALGQLTTDANPATFATNGSDEVLITSGDTGYVLTLSTNALTTEVTDVTMGGHVDSFFLALDTVTGTLKISEAADGKTWDASQVQQRSSAPDPWIAMLVVRREIYLFGTKTGEVWYNSGSSPFPFALRSGAFFQIGIAAKWSLAPFGTSLAWLGRSAMGGVRVYALSGYTPVPISNHAIDWAIQQYEDAGSIDDAIGWGYERLGHTFYVLEFPSAGKTWVYDQAVNQWHERGRWNSLANNFSSYRPRFHASCFGKSLVCDNASGKIYSFSETVYTDVGGGVLRRVRRLPSLSNENRRLFLDYLEVAAEPGVGLLAGQGVDPLLMLRTSWDGGQTWGTERTRSLGARGQYSHRIRWDRLGSGRDLAVELSCSDPVPVRLFDVYVGVS